MYKTLWRLGASVGLTGTLLLAGCATPTFISNASSSGDQVKFVYSKDNFFAAPEEGVIKCDVEPDGSLTNCRKMPIKLDGKNIREN